MTHVSSIHIFYNLYSGICIVEVVSYGVKKALLACALNFEIYVKALSLELCC